MSENEGFEPFSTMRTQRELREEIREGIHDYQYRHKQQQTVDNKHHNAFQLEIPEYAETATNIDEQRLMALVYESKVRFELDSLGAQARELFPKLNEQITEIQAAPSLPFEVIKPVIPNKESTETTFTKLFNRSSDPSNTIDQASLAILSKNYSSDSLRRILSATDTSQPEFVSNLKTCLFERLYETLKDNCKDPIWYIQNILEITKVELTPKDIKTMEKIVSKAIAEVVDSPYSESNGLSCDNLLANLHNLKAKFGIELEVTSIQWEKLLVRDLSAIITNQKTLYSSNKYRKSEDMQRDLQVKYVNAWNHIYELSGPISNHVIYAAAANFFTDEDFKQRILRLGERDFVFGTDSLLKNSINFLMNLNHEPLDIHQLQRTMLSQDSDIYQVLNSWHRDSLLFSDPLISVAISQAVPNYEFLPNPEELQAIYLTITDKIFTSRKHEQLQQLYEFLIKRTGVLPCPDIVNDLYKKRPLTKVRAQIHLLPDEETTNYLAIDALQEYVANEPYDYQEESQEDFLKDYMKRIDHIQEITMNKVKFSAETIETICLESIRNNKDKLPYILQIAQKYDSLPQSISSIVHYWEIKNDSELIKFIDTNIDYITAILTGAIPSPSITKADYERYSPLGLTLMEMEYLNHAKVDLSDLAAQNKYREMYQHLIEQVPGWADNDIVATKFKLAAETFGYKEIFRYINRSGLSRHDVLHQMEAIIALYESSGLTKEQFYGNILQQVQRDDAIYPNGSAHARFNELAVTLNRNYSDTLVQARDYTEINQLSELAGQFSDTKSIFDSWAKLRRFADLSYELTRKEVMEKLLEIKQKGDMVKYHFFETILFHPHSKVDFAAVTQFLEDPERFFDAPATHTPDEVQNAKKPTNYTTIMHLDLTAEQLRDGLIDGSFDSIQSFPPLEITYEIQFIGGQPVRTQAEIVSCALGSREKKIKGAAKNPQLLFGKLKNLLKPYSLTVQQYLQNDQIDPALEAEINKLVFDPNFGITSEHVETQTYTAKIGLKSDPHTIIAGNDTSGCDPFGDGKRTVYIFNPNVGQFTIQKTIEGDTRLRTIAQSTLTEDVDIGTSVPAVRKKMESGSRNISELLPPTIIQQNKSVLSCDNVEVAPNYRDDQNKRLIEMLYEDFFSTYLEMYGQQHGFYTNHLVIGVEGYEGGFARRMSYPEINNTFAPRAPVSYSDKVQEQVKRLTTNNTKRFTNKTIQTETPQTEYQRAPLPDIPGIDYLTYRDTFPVAWIEEKAFDNSPSLIVGLHKIENTLIAKDLNNATKSRPDLCLKYVDGNGQIAGYLIAYEGTIAANEDSFSLSDNDEDNQRIIYINDLSKKPGHRLAGAALVDAFSKLYKQVYLDQDPPDLVPLYMHARDTTSYKIIQKRLEKISEGLGLDFEVHELRDWQSGNGETMHTIMIVPRIKE